MKMDHAAALSPAANDTTQVFLELGARLLHDTLEQLGVMSKLQEAAVGLPDARSRLDQPGILSRNQGGKAPAYPA
jgi:chemotaxis protein CheZ